MIGDYLIISGGRQNWGTICDIWSINIKDILNDKKVSWKKIDLSLGNLYNHSMLINNNIMYIFGGNSGFDYNTNIRIVYNVDCLLYSKNMLSMLVSGFVLDNERKYGFVVPQSLKYIIQSFCNVAKHKIRLGKLINKPLNGYKMCFVNGNEQILIFNDNLCNQVYLRQL